METEKIEVRIYEQWIQVASDRVSITDNSKERDNYIAEKIVAISYHEDIMKGASQSLSFPKEYAKKLELIR